MKLMGWKKKNQKPGPGFETREKRASCVIWRTVYTDMKTLRDQTTKRKE